MLQPAFYSRSRRQKSGQHDKKNSARDAFKAAAIELVKVQREIIENNAKVLVIFEGRDAAGKDGAIKRVTKNMSPRETRIVALGKPIDRESRAWYFERYVAHLPVAGEIALFNRLQQRLEAAE